MLAAAILALAFTASAQAACTDSSSTTAQLQSLLTEGGQGYTLSLCQNQVYYLSDTLNYTASGQVSLWRTAEGLAEACTGNINRRISYRRDASRTRRNGYKPSDGCQCRGRGLGLRLPP